VVKLNAFVAIMFTNMYSAIGEMFVGMLTRCSVKCMQRTFSLEPRSLLLMRHVVT